MEERLISKVRSREILYNIKAPDYRNSSKRAKAWKEIGQELRIPAQTAKDTWEKLRRCHNNAISRRRRNKIKGSTTAPPWRYEKQMAFVLPDDSEFSSDVKEEDFPKDPLDDGASVYEDESSDPRCNRNDTDESHRLKLNKFEDATNSVLDDLSSSPIMEPIRQDEKSERLRPRLDETEMFFLSLAKTTQTLPTLEQAKVKMRISRIVFQAQIEMDEKMRGKFE